ncbi:hypothetical protein GCM10017767_17000 [Halomonas urumqiensis]|nr:hypothetical protein GCM10017767_17000 [Halomonas urumqiensis]
MKDVTLRHALAAMIFASLLVGTPAMADLQVDAGATNESTAVVKISLDKQLSLEHFHPRLSLRLTTGVLLLSETHRAGNAAWVLSPALRFTFAGNRGLFIEGGIGAAFFLEPQLGSRQLSTTFQFEDRLAMGRAFGDGELSLAVTHYSNGGIKRPNEGFETLTLGYRWKL